MRGRKGHTNNPNGRPKGALNKKTKEAMSHAQQLIERMEQHPKFNSFLDNLSEKEFGDLYKNVLEYLEPKLQRMQHTGGDGEDIVFEVIHSVAAQKTPSAIEVDEPSQIKSAVKLIDSGTQKPF